VPGTRCEYSRRSSISAVPVWRWSGSQGASVVHVTMPLQHDLGVQVRHDNSPDRLIEVSLAARSEVEYILYQQQQGCKAKASIHPATFDQTSTPGPGNYLHSATPRVASPLCNSSGSCNLLQRLRTSYWNNAASEVIFCANYRSVSSLF
jgi:hypothetical protein